MPVDFSLTTTRSTLSIVLLIVGQELRKAREAAGFTQEQLAFKADLHRTYISMLGRDKKSPTLDVLFRICRVLKVPASELIARVDRAKICN